MNKTRAEARAFADALRGSPIAQSTDYRPFIIPPFPSIADVAERLAGTKVMVGAQNMHWANQGAWTGEISPLMIKECGATLVELGHSERRTHFGETDETVALKVAAALAHGLIPLVCIGDTRADYEAGRTAEVLAGQVRSALSKADAALLPRVLFAYDPVWSIGEGGVPADPDFANEQHEKIRSLTGELCGTVLPVLYGGSVNPSNCVSLVKRPAIDGLFIGRSAWDVEGFIGIVQAVTEALA
jgi:triosephosphate isomerase